jgi:hypothetical protein
MDPQQLAAQAQAVLSQPSREEVEQLLRTDVLRQYRIDIETDSTIRADLTRSQETMGRYIEGLAAYAAAVTPLVQAQMMPPDVAVDVAVAFSRPFKLGKMAEDALDRLSGRGKQLAETGLPTPPDPEMEKVALEKQRMGAEVEAKKAEMAATEAQATRDQEYRMAQEETKRIGETAKAEAERVKAQSEADARGEERKMKALEMLLRLKEGEDNATLKREEIGTKTELERAKLADAKEGRTMERKDKLAERTGKTPDDLVEADRVGEATQSVTAAIDKLAELVAENAKQQKAGFERLEKIMLSPAVIDRDKKTGKVTGARRVVN